jgi:hypothetical protein
VNVVAISLGDVYVAVVVAHTCNKARRLAFLSLYQLA